MKNIFISFIFVANLWAVTANADTFEFVTYTPPASGWTKVLPVTEGVAYRRDAGIGLISIYASTAATGSASDEFAKVWRQRVETTLPGSAPQPDIRRDGDHEYAIGLKKVDAQGTVVAISVVTIVGRGRAIGLLTMTSGDDVFQEAARFLDSIKLDPRSQASTSSTYPRSNAIDVDFDVPSGYMSAPDAQMIVLKPTTVGELTPCVYGVSTSRPSSGNLEADARAAILEALPGWQLKSDHFTAMRGVAAAGWPYFWYRTDVQSLVGGSYQYLSAMTMAFPGRAGLVNIVWGFGNPARCMLDDLSFARLFHSLRPRGWSSDGGKAFTAQLQGTWRNSQRVGMAQYKFIPSGRYEFGIGTTTTFGVFERTSSSVSDGRWSLNDGELTLTPDARSRGVSKYRVRIYDEYVLGRWTRAMSILDEKANLGGEVQYMKITN